MCERCGGERHFSIFCLDCLEVMTLSEALKMETGK